MSSNTTVDVLIVGAGPAGLMCAFNLAQAGINVRIVDRRPERLSQGQADVIQIRGIEILDSLGLASKIIPTAHHVYAVSTYKADLDGQISRISKVDSHFGVESRFRFTANNAQTFIESLFREAMASGEEITREPGIGIETTPRKVLVEQGIYPTSLTVSKTEDEYPAEIQLENGQGRTEVVRAKYVLGCDGAHSWVRTQLGIDMVGDTSSSVWGLIDVSVDTNFPDIRNLTVVENNGRRGVVVPRENDTVRFTIQLTEEEVRKDPNTGRIDRTQVTANKLIQLAQDVFKPYRIDIIGDPLWYGVYVIGQRLASAYEGAGGRVLIVGDACHTHSPHAGQGMNAALSDGYNLAWKLVHTLRGWAGPELLHTYELERRAFAKDLIVLHERIAEAMSGKAKGTNADVMIKSMGFVCGTSIRYEPSIVIDPENQVLAKGIPIGQRLPHQVIIRVADGRPHSTHDLLKVDYRYTLLLFTGDIKIPTQRKRLETFLEGVGIDRTMMKLFTILLAKKEACEYTDVPEEARSHWSTVFVDDIAYTTTDGGGTAYQSLGIGSEGCAVLVRPDGHVAMVASLDGVREIKGFFERVKAR